MKDNEKNLSNALNDDEMKAVAGGELKFKYWNPTQRKALDSFYGSGYRRYTNWIRREFDPASAIIFIRERLQKGEDCPFTAEQIDKLEKDLGLC